MAAELSRQNLPWDEWQIIYRLLLQVETRPAGRGAFARARTRMEERDMAERNFRCRGRGTWRNCPRGNRCRPPSPLRCRTCRIGADRAGDRQRTQLAKKEIELAKSELRSDIKAELTMAKGLGVAGLCALWAVG